MGKDGIAGRETLGEMNQLLAQAQFPEGKVFNMGVEQSGPSKVLVYLMLHEM